MQVWLRVKSGRRSGTSDLHRRLAKCPRCRLRNCRICIQGPRVPVLSDRGHESFFFLVSCQIGNRWQAVWGKSTTAAGFGGSAPPLLVVVGAHSATCAGTTTLGLSLNFDCVQNLSEGTPSYQI